MESKLNVWQKEPMLVILNGLGAAISLTLLACNATGALSWSPSTIAVVVGAVEGWCNLFALALRAYVSPVAKVRLIQSGQLPPIE